MNSNLTRILLRVLALAASALSLAQADEIPSDAKLELIWQKTNFPDTEACEAIVFDPLNPKRIVIGTRPGGLWESLDHGETWSKLRTIMPSALRYGFNPGSIVSHPRIKNLWYAGVERNGAYRSRDAGNTWEQINTGFGTGSELNGISFTFDANDDATVFYGSDGGLYKSSDGGDHWTKCTHGLPQGDEKNPGTSVLRMATDPASGALYAGYYDVGSKEEPGIYKSTDHGESWQAINIGIEMGPDEATLKAVESASEKLAGVKTGDSLASNPWTSDKAWCFDLQMSPANPKVLFAATWGGLYRTDNAGEHWHKCDSVCGPRSVAFRPKEPRTIVASGFKKVWMSCDGGQTWRDISAGLNDPEKAQMPPQIIDMGNGLKGEYHQVTDIFGLYLIAFDPSGKRLFALTSQGLWVATLPENESTQTPPAAVRKAG